MKNRIMLFISGTLFLFGVGTLVAITYLWKVSYMPTKTAIILAAISLFEAVFAYIAVEAFERKEEK